MVRRGTTPALCAHYSANPYYREYGAIGGYTIPLLAGAIRRGERVAIATEARGLGPGIVRTYYRHPPLRAGRHRGALCARGREHSDSGGSWRLDVLRIWRDQLYSGVALSHNFVCSGCILLVCLGGHDEIVAMQTLDLVCPPGDRHFAPFSQQRGMMSFCLCSFTDVIGKRQCLGKIPEFEDALESFDTIAFHNLPCWHLWMIFAYLRVRNRRLTYAAGNAFHLGQCVHLGPPSKSRVLVELAEIAFPNARPVRR